MKLLIRLSLTVALLLTIATSSSFAQPFLGNRTACPMEMGVIWGNAVCATTGSFSAVVPPFSVVAIPVPPGNQIIASRGAYVGTSCVYYVGIPCSGFGFTDSVVCTTACGNYRARLDNWGVVAFQ